MDLKRGVDLVLGVPALVLTAPLQGVVAAAVAIDLGRPVLFRQQRPGLGGRPFELVKFRTMRRYDEARGWTDDAARLTPFGRWLRSTSLDELPTLWNVVRGDMSLVGPRPLLMQYLDRYTAEQARRHEVRPGMTGLAQVMGRNSIGWEHRLAIDVEYVETHTLRGDLVLIWRTVSTVLHRRGISADGEATMAEFRGTGR